LNDERVDGLHGALNGAAMVKDSATLARAVSELLSNAAPRARSRAS
jgi:hypothetical protein